MRTFRLGIAMTTLLAGCYTLEPTGGISPEPGSRVALQINDAGRVALGGLVGPEIDVIEGRLVGKQNDEYMLAVTGVKFIRGGEQVWSGERVNVRSEYVGTVFERRYSAGRSVTLGAVGIAGITAFVLSRDLLGLGTGGDPKSPPGKGESESLIRP